MALIAGVQYSGNPVGTILPCATNTALPMTLLCNGNPVSRVGTYAALFAAITTSFTSVNTNGTTTLTIVGQNPVTLGILAGMPISGTNIPGGATVSSVTSSTIVISSPATGTTTGGTAVVCPYGVGDGSTTFNVPNAQGVFLRGSGSQVINAVTYSGTMGIRQRDAYPSHDHGGGNHAHSITVYDGGTTTDNAIKSSAYFGGVRTGGTQASGTIISFNGTGTETQPANIGINYCIAY
jgi:hypothetical protein